MLAATMESAVPADQPDSDDDDDDDDDSKPLSQVAENLKKVGVTDDVKKKKKKKKDKEKGTKRKRKEKDSQILNKWVWTIHVIMWAQFPTMISVDKHVL